LSFDGVVKLSSSSVGVVVEDRDSCVFLHEISWVVMPSRKFDPLLNNNSVNYDRFWSWSSCSYVDSSEFQKLKLHVFA